MLLPIDGDLLGQSIFTQVWEKQGTSVIVGGGFVTVSGKPSQQLLASTNETLGYFNGQMLARASGVKSDTTPSGLTAGALINFDPASLDTGQKVWCKWVIADDGLTAPFPLTDPITGDPFVPFNTIQVATQLNGWIMRPLYFYASGTPLTDISIVNTALSSAGVNQFTIQNTCGSNGNNETVFSY